MNCIADGDSFDFRDSFPKQIIRTVGTNNGAFASHRVGPNGISDDYAALVGKLFEQFTTIAQKDFIYVFTSHSGRSREW